MRAYVRTVGTTSRSNMDSGAIHYEHRCRLSIVPDPGDAVMTPEQETALEVSLRAALERTFQQWLDDHQMTREELTTNTEAISVFGRP